MKRTILILLIALLVAAPCVTGTRAQNNRSAGASGKSRAKKVKKSEREKTRDAAQAARDDLLKAAKEYKTSLEELLVFYEKNVGRAAEQRDKLKGLYSEGLVSRVALEEGDEAVAEAQRKVDGVKKQIASADKMVAETLVEIEISPQITEPPRPTGKLTNTVAFIRYGGAGQWALSDAWKIQSFFKERFGVPLPVSTFGQSNLHDRWGLDHRNAMDVGVNPDSPQGQALMAFLRANGVPFTAFRVAIQGSSTGPHIHIGFPSRRSLSPFSGAR